MRFTLRYKILFFAFLFFAFGAFAQTVFKTSDPKDYANKLGDRIVEIVESKVPNDQKQQTLIDLLNANSDTDYMAKFAMGKYFRQATPEQQKKYLSLYKDYVIYSYIPRFREYQGERQQVLSAIDQGQGEYVIKTTITSPRAKTGKINVDYRVRKAGGSFKLIDVIGEGVSLLTTQRSDFATPISQKGIDYFLERLEVKVVKQKAIKWDDKIKKK